MSTGRETVGHSERGRGVFAAIQEAAEIASVVWLVRRSSARRGVLGRTVTSRTLASWAECDGGNPRYHARADVAA